MQDNNYKKLSTRHILMIAIGSAIGTGLFFGAGQSIKLAGPAIILAYIIGGAMIYIVIRALGEMAVHDPNIGSFSYYAYKYLGNFAGFISGWNYWFNYIIVCMLEITAATVFLDFWFHNIPHWITALFILLLFSAINLFNVRLFGEFEFWFAGIKVVIIIALIITGIYLISDHNNHVQSNIHNLWRFGGFFATGLKGFLFSFIIVIFAFGGSELIGISAAESKSPEKNIPSAVNGIIIRIILFYIATITIILCLYPWNQISSTISPFTDVFQKIGISKAANLMNIVAITAALSSLNSGIYTVARMLYNLSVQKHAPKFFAKLNRQHTPARATWFALAIIYFTILLNYLFPQKLLLILIAIATAAAIINWLTILVTQIAFRRKTNKQQIHYKIPFYPLSTIIAIIFFIAVIIVMTQMSDMRLAIYILPVWLLFLSTCYAISKFRK